MVHRKPSGPGRYAKYWKGCQEDNTNQKGVGPSKSKSAGIAKPLVAKGGSSSTTVDLIVAKMPTETMAHSVVKPANEVKPLYCNPSQNAFG